MLKNKKNIIRFAALSFLIVIGLAFYNLASAQVDVGMNEIGNNIELGQQDPRTTAGRVINIVMLSLGIICVGLIIWGGFVWMTSNGDESKVDKAKLILKNGVIGLVIILSAWGIATFVLTRLLGSNNGNGTGGCADGQINPCGCGGSMACIDGSWGSCLGSDCNSGGGPESCDSNTILGGCQGVDQICAVDNYCDNETCSCVPKSSLGESCDADESNPSCEADNSLCGDYLSCNPESCLCEGQPVITRVSPAGGFCEEDQNKPCLTDDDCTLKCDLTTPNGDNGNIITISGTNFGAFDPQASKVFFGGDIPGLSPSAINPQCIDSWTNKQIIIVVPEGTTSGPLKVQSADGQNDTTDNDVGPIVPDFINNDIKRPGLCLLTPETGRLSDKVNYFGINLYEGQAYFGDYVRNVRGLDSQFNNPQGVAGTTTVPNIQKGGMTSFVVGSVNGFPQKSNYVTFLKEQEPDAGPYISYFEPATGRAGQYVTIHGGGLGGARGTAKVMFGDKEADYSFPDVCASSVWSDKQVIVKVPADLQDGYYPIAIIFGDGERIDSQNANPNAFNVDANVSLKSSICRISPVKGPVGTSVSIWGEYFGNNGGDGLSVFSRDKGVSGTISTNQGAQRLLPAVPTGAVSGPVKVVKNGEWGNDTNFEIGTCTSNQECGSETCCPAGTYMQGRCAPSLASCYISIKTSVFEWGFSTGLGEGGDTPVDYDSCNGMAQALGACQVNAFCPNSPGVCSPFAGAPKNLGPCDSTCAANPSCLGQSCSFDSGLDACVLNEGSCSLPEDFAWGEFTQERTCQVFPQFGDKAHWQITTPTSCPTGWVRLDGNRCVDSVSSSASTCDVCAAGFSCKDANGAGKCVTAELCRGDAKCQGQSCVSQASARCDCCCEIGQDSRDCCAGLVCGGTCGTDTTDDGSGFGECTGCKVEVGGQVDVAKSDAACNCSSSSGKYCDTSSATGACVDCSRLSASSCLDHSGACCLDSKGTESSADDVCTGGSGQLLQGADKGYCARYECDASDPSVCASSTPSKLGRFKSVEACTDSCEADPGGENFCNQFNGSLDECNAAAGCCFNFSDNKCKSGEELPSGYCAYYNCKAAPNNNECDSGNAQATGTYSGLDACIKGCAFDPIFKPGTDCRNRSSQTGCNTGFCLSPFACLTEQGETGTADNCGSCCCEVGNASSCSGVGNGNLVCQPNQAPCSGDDRGLCCGCSADTDCGDQAVVGCDSGTCCRARPSILDEELKPAHGATEVCRNAGISIPFDQSMDPSSLAGNILLLEENDYGSGVCPAGTFVAAADGFQPVSEHWLARVYRKVAMAVRSMLMVSGLKSDTALAGVPDPNKLYCSVPGDISYKKDGNGTVVLFTPKRLLSAGADHYLIIKGDQALDSNSGVMSQWSVGLNGEGYLDLASGSYVEGESLSFNNLTFGNSYISTFRTLPSQSSNSGVCAVEYVAVEPGSYLFSENAEDISENDDNPAAANFDVAADRDKVFSAEAYSADEQILHPATGYYWDWVWHVTKQSVASIQEVAGLPANRAMVQSADNISDDSTVLSAGIDMQRFASPSCNSASSCVCAGPDCANNCCNGYMDGDGAMAEAPLFVFLCKNPWPAVNKVTQTWSPWYDTCTGAIGACQNYNYKFYYCRDAGKEGMSDDLPAMINPAVIRGTGSSLICSEGRGACTDLGGACGPDRNGDGAGDGFCIWDVLKESYFFKESTPTAGSISAAIDLENGHDVRLEWSGPSNLIYNLNPVLSGRYRIYYSPVDSGAMAFADAKPTDVLGGGLPGTVCTPVTPSSGQNYSCRFFVTGLEPGREYRFKVSAISASQVESPLSDEKTVLVTDKIAPVIPQGLAGSIQTGQRLKFTWQPQADASFFRLYHGIASGLYGESFDSEPGATELQIGSTGWTGNHFFAISALDASGNESGKSTPITINIAQ
ncbi:MAG: IPT/TIG domain-containing protein [Bacillota bacterium]